MLDFRICGWFGEGLVPEDGLGELHDRGCTEGVAAPGYVAGGEVEEIGEGWGGVMGEVGEG